MYHIKNIIKFINGRPKSAGGYEITDDNGFIIESFASEETMKYYESLNKEERARRKSNKMDTELINNGIICDIDSKRRIESIGWTYDGEMRYDTKLFIIFDPKTDKEIERKCFYFLVGPISKGWANNILDKITAKDFDEYMKNPNYTKFKFVPAHIEVFEKNIGWAIRPLNEQKG